MTNFVMIMDKCRLCGTLGNNFSPIFSGKLDIAGRLLRCLPVKIMESNDLSKKICDSCTKVVDISYKMILKSMEIDREFMNSVMKNFENQKSNSSSVHMEPQVLVISHRKNREECIQNVVVVEKAEDDMEIDVESDAEPQPKLFNHDIKIYCYYEDKEEEITTNYSRRLQKRRILTEHSYATSSGSTGLSEKINLTTDHNIKITIAKATLPVLRDHNYFKKSGDPLIDHFDRFCNEEMSMDHDYYDKNSFSGRKKMRMSSYPCKLYPRALASFLSLDTHEFRNASDANYTWEFHTGIKTEPNLGEVWRESQMPQFVFVKCEESV